MTMAAARSRFADPREVARRERGAGERLPYARHLDDTTIEGRPKTFHCRSGASRQCECRWGTGTNSFRGTPFPYCLRQRI